MDDEQTRTDDDTASVATEVTDLTAPGEVDGDPAQGPDADTESQEVADTAATREPPVVPVREEWSDDEPSEPASAEVTAVHEVSQTTDDAVADLDGFVERSEEAAGDSETAEEDADAEIAVPEAEAAPATPTPKPKPKPKPKKKTATKAKQDAAAEAEAAPAADPFKGPGDWYVVHTYAGYENKVKTNLNSRIHTMQMEDKIFDVHIPMEDVMEIKGGKKQVVQ
ncbi:MAG: transcription termination/antitermination NusG family protein, partial [Actinomycetota bacterium]